MFMKTNVGSPVGKRSGHYKIAQTLWYRCICSENNNPEGAVYYVMATIRGENTLLLLCNAWVRPIYHTKA